MLGGRRIIRNGDPVIVYGGVNSLDIIYVEENKTYDGRHGHYFHNSLIGLEYGSKIFSHNGKGFIQLLKPTPELWTATLAHRTEILYPTDISLITLHLELRPGMTVLESGTGSGGLSTAIARTIAPNGRLFTYEFHQGRTEAAHQDFKRNKIDHIVTVTCRDVCEAGFHVPDNSADAIFLDLPKPWLAIPHAVVKLKQNRRICSFSPCIEQVQKTCIALQQHEFSDITTLECLLRPHDVINLAEKSEQNDEEDKKKQQRRKSKKEKKHKKHQQQQAKGKQNNQQPQPSQHIKSQTMQQSQQPLPSESQQPLPSESQQPLPSEPQPMVVESQSSLSGASSPLPADSRLSQRNAPKRRMESSEASFASSSTAYEMIMVTKPTSAVKGHSGYLTFARKPVVFTDTNQQ